MARYRKVYVATWADDRFRRLSAPQPNAQTLWFRLLTGPETANLPGLFVSGEAGLAEALGWPLKAFREAFTEVRTEGMAKADWTVRVVWVPKAIRYNEPESPNVVRSWRVPWSEIPDCDLKREAYGVLRAYCEGKGEGFSKAFREACGHPLANPEPEPKPEPEPEQEKKTHAADAAAVVVESPDALLWAWNTHCRDLPKATALSSERRKHARARLRERPLAEWVEIVKRIASSAFCRGGGPTGWKADFDWLLKPATALRVLEGKYDARTPTERPWVNPKTQGNAAAVRAFAERTA